MPEDILIDDFGRGRHVLQRLRDATTDQLCDVSSSIDEEDFRHRAAVIPLDGALLIDGWTSAYSNARTSRHIAAGGIDHYMVTLCLAGSLTFQSGRRSQVLSPGDICLIDMGQASRTVIGADEKTGLSHTVTLIIPRTVLAPLLATPDAATASLIPRHSRTAQLLGAQYAELREHAGGTDGQIQVQTMAGVIADAVGSASSAEQDVDYASRTLLLSAIKRHVSSRPPAETLDSTQICRQFQISRATLYRLFEAEGGLWHYVQEQQLHRAFSKLASSSGTPAHLVEIAAEFGFGSDNTFVRAFRKRFGLTPGEVRRLAIARQRHAGDGIPESVGRIRALADR
ncbi:helix-turn-helix domain-containing protein [Bradyrhizobium sp. HKCCYLR20261]|uniref:helix-turn-helix domain-containing protein n=1 Tax=Bradyrhizobium sp. HKCCYLR20261 TaxID=3420760 RepID=UPI003EB99010